MPAERSWGRVAASMAAMSFIAAACSSGGSRASPTTTTRPPTPITSGGAVTTADIHKIRHVVVIMQENRSFDSYFGTYPGADGIPPGACIRDPKTNSCERPYHDAYMFNRGGPHGKRNALQDVDGGRMDGFIAQARDAEQTCTNFANP